MKKQLPVIQTSPLPALYAGWMDQMLVAPIPVETDATCSDCAMCATESQSRSRSEFFYNPETKCCTFVPTVPNFLVGRILEDDDPALAAGRKTVEERLRSGLAVTPLGMGMPPTFNFLYTHTATKTFGQSKALRCPHYIAENGGRCGIWKHRASVCATWYCKYVRGAVGAKFWGSLHQLLSAVELTLSQWCVYQLEIDIDALKKLFSPRNPLKPYTQLDGLALDGKVDPNFYKEVWGKWFGREQELFCKAAQLVNGLNWEDIVRIGGTDLKIFERIVRDNYSQLRSEELPASLKLGNLSVVSMGPQCCRLSTYSSIDPLDVPQQLLSVLHYFDGRSTQDALNEIQEKERIQLSPELVRKLADFEVLVPAYNRLITT